MAASNTDAMSDVALITELQSRLKVPRSTDISPLCSAAALLRQDEERTAARFERAPCTQDDFVRFLACWDGSSNPAFYDTYLPHTFTNRLTYETFTDAATWPQDADVVRFCGPESPGALRPQSRKRLEIAAFLNRLPTYCDCSAEARDCPKSNYGNGLEDRQHSTCATCKAHVGTL